MTLLVASTWRGKMFDDLSRDEMIDALEWSARKIAAMRAEAQNNNPSRWNDAQWEAFDEGPTAPPRKERWKSVGGIWYRAE